MMLKPRERIVEEISKDFAVWIRRFTNLESEMLESFPTDVVDCSHHSYDREENLTVHINPRGKHPITEFNTKALVNWARTLLKSTEVKPTVWDDGEVAYIVTGACEDAYGTYAVTLWIHNAAVPNGSKIESRQVTRTKYTLINDNETKAV